MVVGGFVGFVGCWGSGVLGGGEVYFRILHCERELLMMPGCGERSRYITEDRTVWNNEING